MNNFNHKIFSTNLSQDPILQNFTSTKNQMDINRNSLIFQYPFLMSSIKKIDGKQRDKLFYQQYHDHDHVNSPTGSPIQNSPNRQNQAEQQAYSHDINDDSSIDFAENEEVDEQTEKEIQSLEKQITLKLNDQYFLLRQKLKAKSKEREEVLKQFRQISTIGPLRQRHLQQNQKDSNNTSTMQKSFNKKKPLDTKSIKNRIVKRIEDSQYVHVQNMTEHKENSTFTYTFKFQNLSKQNETPQMLKSIQHKEVQSLTHLDNSDLIRQMGEQLRKMEFKQVQDIAKGNFNFSKRK